MEVQRINEFNQTLIKSDSKYDLIEYIKNINILSKNPIDLNFMEELLQYVEKDKCIIHHSLLIKYGVLAENGHDSRNTIRMLKDYNFIENEDYLVLNIEHQLPSGTKYKKDYLLHPQTFKFCIMRSKNTKIYAKYYLLLEKAVKYYHEYQIMYKEYIINQKDEKIDILNKKVDELLIYAKDTKEDINTLLEFSIEQTEQAELSELKVSTIIKDRINIPSNSNNNEMLILIKQFNSNYDYYVIKGTMQYVKAKYRSVTKIHYKDRLTISNENYKFIAEFINVPNVRHLFRAIKDYYNYTNIVSNVNEFSIDVSEERLKEIITEVFESRYTIEIEIKEKDIVNKKVIKKIKNITNNCKTI